MADATGDHPDHDLAVLRRRQLDFLDLHRLSLLEKHCCLHAVPPYPLGSVDI